MLGEPKHEGKDEENLTHFFRHCHEIYSMAVHYYDEDEIKVGKAITCRVAVNHIVELTEEEKAEARQEAIKQYQREELAKIQSRNARPQKKETAEVAQPSLFDF